MDFKSFIETCDQHGQTTFWVGVFIIAAIGAIFKGLYYVISAIKQKEESRNDYPE